MNKHLSKYAYSHEQYTVTELDSEDFSSRTTNKDGRVVWIVVDPPPYAGMLSHAPNSLGIVEVVVCAFTFHCVPSCRPPAPLSALADCLCLYWKLCLISGWERIHSVVYTEDKHWRRSVISMLCAGESQIVFLPHHRCVSACCSLTRESLFIPTDTPRPT